MYPIPTLYLEITTKTQKPKLHPPHDISSPYKTMNAIASARATTNTAAQLLLSSPAPPVETFGVKVFEAGTDELLMTLAKGTTIALEHSVPAETDPAPAADVAGCAAELLPPPTPAGLGTVIGTPAAPQTCTA
jgi:hypothetical protein